MLDISERLASVIGIVVLGMVWLGAMALGYNGLVTWLCSGGITALLGIGFGIHLQKRKL